MRVHMVCSGVRRPEGTRWVYIHPQTRQPTNRFTHLLRQRPVAVAGRGGGVPQRPVHLREVKERVRVRALQRPPERGARFCVCCVCCCGCCCGWRRLFLLQALPKQLVRLEGREEEGPRPKELLPPAPEDALQCD